MRPKHENIAKGFFVRCLVVFWSWLARGFSRRQFGKKIRFFDQICLFARYQMLSTPVVVTKIMVSIQKWLLRVGQSQHKTFFVKSIPGHTLSYDLWLTHFMFMSFFYTELKLNWIWILSELLPNINWVRNKRWY